MGNFVKPDVLKIGDMYIFIYYLIIIIIMIYIFLGDQNNTVELARLLQLILGCAVNCNNAQSMMNNFLF